MLREGMIFKENTKLDFGHDEIELPLKHPNAIAMQEEDDKSL